MVRYRGSLKLNGSNFGAPLYGATAIILGKFSKVTFKSKALVVAPTAGGERQSSLYCR